MSIPVDEKEKKSHPSTSTPTPVPPSPPPTSPTPPTTGKISEPLTKIDQKMAATIDRTNVVATDALATRLEGCDHISTPNAHEYAKYDQLRETSARIQKITERLAARSRSPPISKTQRHTMQKPSKPLRTPEERAAAAAAMAGSSELSPSSPQQSRELTAYGRQSSEGSLEDSAVTPEIRSAIAACGMRYLRPLGRGSYGNVVLAESCGRPAKHIAVKVVEMGAHEFRYIRKVLVRELHVQSNVEPHEHLMHVDKVFRYGRVLMFLMPFSSNGDLYEYIRKHGYLNEQSACRLFYQMCLGVEHLHRQGYAHRDLKCENVLLDENFDVKLTDFGFTCSLTPKPKTPELVNLDAELSRSTKQSFLVWSMEVVRSRKESEKHGPNTAADQSHAKLITTQPEVRPEKVDEKKQEKPQAGKSAPKESKEKKTEEPKKVELKKPLLPMDTPSASPSPLPPPPPPPSLPVCKQKESPHTDKPKQEEQVYAVYRKFVLPPEVRHRAEHTRILSEDNEVQFTQTYCGSLLYACPELLNRELYDPRAADVWSLGVILWVMLFNCYPYEDRRMAVRALAANTCVFELPYRPSFSEPCKTLLRKMLVKEDFRIRLNEVIQFEWIQTNKPHFATPGIQTVNSGAENTNDGRAKLGYRQFTGSFDL